MSNRVLVQTDSGDVRELTHSRSWGWLDGYGGLWRKDPARGPRHWAGASKGSTRWAVEVDVS